MYCGNCGSQIPENESICPNCGANNTNTGNQNNFSQDNFNNSDYNQQGYNNQMYNQPNYNQQYNQPNQMGYPYLRCAIEPFLDYTPLSMWAYFGYTILFAIPILGFIFLLIFSFGGTKNINLRNYSRGMLILLVIGYVVAIILGTIIATTLGAFIGSMYGVY